jgi:adenylyl cyclase-associated protein
MTFTDLCLAIRDPKQIEWVRSFYQIFRELSNLVKQRFSNGIAWNPNGQSVAELARAPVPNGISAAAPQPPASGAPPPPPPPGPPPVLDIKAEATDEPASTNSGFGAVFSELNKGEAVTKGLRKVEKSQMTHKNPSLRAGSTVSDGSSVARAKSPAPGKKPKPESMRVKKPARKELEGNKWTVVSAPFPSSLIAFMRLTSYPRRTTRRKQSLWKLMPL